MCELKKNVLPATTLLLVTMVVGAGWYIVIIETLDPILYLPSLWILLIVA